MLWCFILEIVPLVVVHCVYLLMIVWKLRECLLKKKSQLSQYIYIVVGGQEHKTMRKEAKAIASVFHKAGGPNVKVDFLELPNENHATILHQSISEAFKKLFP